MVVSLIQCSSTGLWEISALPSILETDLSVTDKLNEEIDP